MSIHKLRKNYPNYNWKAVRNGFSWEYVGNQNGKNIKLFCCSQLSGFSEDDFVSVWYAYDGAQSIPFSMWSLSQ